MKKYVIIVVLLALAAVLPLLRHITQKGPAVHTDTEEKQVGLAIADMVSHASDLSHLKKMTVIYLFPSGKPPYNARAEAVYEALEKRGISVVEIWARDEKIYNDDDYTASIDYALSMNTDTNGLLVVGQGSVTHAKVSKRLDLFLRNSGKFFLVGSVTKNSQFARLAERNAVTILARRTLWLKDAEPHSKLADASEYVKNNFTLLGISG